ncbi:DUF6543 domain-containing protein [Pseudomonas sp. Marseille-Q1929]|uniref:dermonecrotic toxin domain-containing protein n=1 Tax=Pseudomonas sp. Marseille-Q1929 TaxID=2730402 RepID=UPI001A8F733B|nr:DUF6543 domain-containing protein [Pseudomonas sp. Marseille-Q1929]MBO0496597.1 hypothetical protein [Pseudomonas sp. Marseille-Q1929]
MASLNPPYFFDEYKRPITRKQPTERERALGLTLDDIKWLNTVFTVSDQDRRKSSPSMIVETLVVNRSGEPNIPLAGSFMMSPAPDAKKAVLYTPYGGIEVFLNRGDCLAQITERLKEPLQHIELTRFLSIKQRHEFSHDTSFTLTAATVAGDVFDDQRTTIETNQAHNVQRMLEELRTTPKLPELLEEIIDTLGFDPDLNGIALEDVRVNSFVTSKNHNGNGMARWVESATLSETLLQFYVKQAWPAQRTRTFSVPKKNKTLVNKKAKNLDVAQWESFVERAAGVLSKLLNLFIQSWWYVPTAETSSRVGLFARVMSDKFRADLLFKRQSESEILSSEEARNLLAVFLPDQTTRNGWHSALQIEKVRIHAPYQHYVQLAATLLISDKHAYLYTQSRGLQVLKDVEDLKDTLLTMLKAAGYEDELLNFLSLDERGLYLAMRDVQVSGSPVEGGVFEALVEDIYDKQLSNLEHALALYRRSDGGVDLTALLDCSLDVRHMLDSRLLALDAAGRWSLHPITSGNGRPSTVQAERAKLQLAALQPYEDTLIAQRAGHPTLRRAARLALNKEMQAQYLYQKSDDVYINTYDSPARDIENRPPKTSLSMLDYLFKHLTDTDKNPSPSPLTRYYNAPQKDVSVRWLNLDDPIFNAIIDKVRRELLQHGARSLPDQFVQNHGPFMLKALMHGLRSEAELRLLNHTLSPNHFAIIDTVLRDDSMTRDKRHGLRGFLPDAFSLTLALNNEKALHPLANCFVLTERGGLDPELSGEVVLWTPQRGYEPFASLTDLRGSLEQRLEHSQQRVALLQNLSIGLRAPHQTYELGPLQRIDGHFLQNRQQSNLALDQAAIDHWTSLSLSPTQLQRCLDEQMLRLAPSNIDKAKAIAQAIVQQHALPVWLGMASTAEQLLHAELLEQHRLSAPDNQDYLHGLPDLREHVASNLTTLLKARYPDAHLDPEDILIPARIVLNGHTQSLTDFAMRHLPYLVPDNLTPKARGSTPLPASLDGSAVVQLVRQLDIGKTYRDLLDTHLSADTDAARQRRHLFCQQLPWQLLRHAHEEHLDERLSAAAWGFIQQIFDMPDAVARDAVTGATAMIRPLELVATAGATPVKVVGMYVIGPRAKATGPLVLYAPYAPINVLKEYGSEEKLLDDINAPGPLQAWVIRQLGDPEQATFRNLFNPAPDQIADEKEEEEKEEKEKKEEKVSLTSKPIRGNILRQLFHDNTAQLLKMLACQFEKEGRSQWDGITSLLREGIPTALQFIAGKLKFPLTVWRSFKLFDASAEALQAQHFSEGLHTFARGLATMASLRKQLDALLPTATVPQAPAPAPAPAQGPAPGSTIDSLDITDPLRTGLQRFEDVAVALTDLQLNPRTHVYTQPVNNRTYVPVAGRVYPVARIGEHWRVSLSNELGPYVERNAQGQWVLDLSLHEPSFGPAVSRLRGHVITQRTIRASINIEAQGMRAIRALDLDKVLCIVRALNVALYYTVTCRRNLNAFAQERDTNSRVGRVLTEMFGMVTFSPTQVSKILDRVREIENGLLAGDLIRLDSQRFVCGKASRNAEETLAFVIPDEAEKRIYLLSLFFDPGLMDFYTGHLDGPFDVDDHVRAATLIHEISHLESHTEDIAYMDAAHPFLDLIKRGTSEGLKKYTTLEHVQSTALSVLTPATQLFKAWNRYEQVWKDLGQTGSTKTYDKVLNLTGAKTLEEARQIFVTDSDRRMDIILANADSVTYLISHLGRQLD